MRNGSGFVRVAEAPASDKPSVGTKYKLSAVCRQPKVSEPK